MSAVVLRVLSEEERDRTRRPFLEAAGTEEGLWVFAYGSLIWSPAFSYDASRPARLYGYHRSFCLRTVHARGSPDRPGLALGLDRGGSCGGLAFHIPPEEIEAGTGSLWAREMYAGLYRPIWARLQVGTDRFRAVTFVADPTHEAFVGRRPREETVETIATAAGKLGSNADYLAGVVAGLAAAGIPDRGLAALWRAVQERLGADPGSEQSRIAT